jgi:hypothetical protein
MTVPDGLGCEEGKMVVARSTVRGVKVYQICRNAILTGSDSSIFFIKGSLNVTSYAADNYAMDFNRDRL